MKNNAVEKVENIIREKSGKKGKEKNKKSGKTDTKKDISEKSNKKVKDRTLVTIISLSVALVLMSGAFLFSMIMPSEREREYETSVKRSFYGTVSDIDNIDSNLSKAVVSNDSASLLSYLSTTAINGELANNDLVSLPLEDSVKFYVVKAVNQIADYSKYLHKKISKGETLSEEDREGLKNIYKISVTLKQALNKIQENMSEDYSFSSILSGGNGNIVVSGFMEMTNLSQSFPELIYDGPFSDGKDGEQIKGLKGSVVSEEDAKNNFEQVFDEYNLSSTEYVGEVLGKIDGYNFKGETMGETLYATMTKCEGKLLSFSLEGDCKDVLYGEDEAVTKAISFLTKLGIENVKAVWINLSSNNVYTINITTEINDIICYADLIKVRVCAYSGRVIGADLTSYYKNHTERSIESALITENQAKEKVSTNISIKNIRLCIVPLENVDEERLCYEVMGEYEDTTYYVYIDAKTASEIKIFKVTKSDRGTLLM